jgi:hypothetical protein
MGYLDMHDITDLGICQGVFGGKMITKLIIYALLPKQLYPILLIEKSYQQQ